MTNKNPDIELYLRNADMYIRLRRAMVCGGSPKILDEFRQLYPGKTLVGGSFDTTEEHYEVIVRMLEFSRTAMFFLDRSDTDLISYAEKRGMHDRIFFRIIDHPAAKQYYAFNTDLFIYLKADPLLKFTYMSTLKNVFGYSLNYKQDMTFRRRMETYVSIAHREMIGRITRINTAGLTGYDFMLKLFKGVDTETLDRLYNSEFTNYELLSFMAAEAADNPVLKERLVEFAENTFLFHNAKHQLEKKLPRWKNPALSFIQIIKDADQIK